MIAVGNIIKSCVKIVVKGQFEKNKLTGSVQNNKESLAAVKNREDITVW